MRGQAWSIDFTLSLFLFSASMVVAYTILSNTVEDQGFNDVAAQARDAADTLAGEGFPEHWNTTNVIRAGLASGGKLSLRKATAMNGLTPQELKQALRITDNVYVYVTNVTDTVGIFGSCGVGDTTVSTGSDQYSLPATAIVSETIMTDTLNNITVHENSDAGYPTLYQNDVLVLEGPFMNSSSMTAIQIANDLSELAETGMTIVMVGNISEPVLGASFSTDDTEELYVQGTAGASLGFNTGETLNMTALVTVPVMSILSDPSVSDFREIALTDTGEVAYADWIYKDAHVYFFGRVQGEREDETDLLIYMTNVTQDMITVERPTCGALELSPLLKHIAHQERAIAYHDMPLTLRVVVWET